MEVEILDLTRLASSGFEILPSHLYSQDLLPLVPQKISKENFQAAFLIKDKGRLVLYHNPHLNFENNKAVALGHFECVNNQEVANLLMNTAKEYAKKMGAYWLVGPMNGSTWDNYRFSLNSDYPNFFLEPYHHLYYNDLWKNAGFKSIARYTSGIDRKMSLIDPEIVSDLKTKIIQSGVIIRPMDMNNYETEITRIHSFCEETFTDNFLYTPISENEFMQKYLPLKSIINPEYVLMAEDSLKNLIAIFFAIRDINNTEIPSLIIKTVARKPNREQAGLISLMCNMGIEKAKNNGFKQTIHAFMHQDNKSNRVSGIFSGELFREYVLYGKKINEN